MTDQQKARCIRRLRESIDVFDTVLPSIAHRIQDQDHFPVLQQSLRNIRQILTPEDTHPPEAPEDDVCLSSLCTAQAIQQLRQQVNILAAALYFLAYSDKQDSKPFSLLNRHLYQMIRTLSHADLLVTENPAHYPATLDLCWLCQELVHQMDSLFSLLRDRHLQFSWDLPNRPIWVQGDTKLLEQAILNLVSNAIQAVSSQGQVTLRAVRKQDYAFVSILDEGPGRKPKPLGKQAFDLSVAQRIASLYKGTVVWEDQAAGGVCFRLSLPILQEAKHRVLHSLPVRYEPTGGFSVAMVELSDLLQDSAFFLTSDEII